jgi:pyruvate/2-oxoglutarate dehydrogenase complex dihydrolipoamide acyltransferase (E2) component
MDSTTSSFTLRKNAKRAAEAMIRNGTAPAVDYSIEPSDNGRFEIVWNTAKTALTTDEVGTEIAEASADQPAAASTTEAASQTEPAATEPATTDAPPQRASEAEAAPRVRASGHRVRPGIERPGTERMATRHPCDGAQTQIVA